MLLYQIGYLAKKSGVSVRTLRYYEQIELLLPTEIRESKYRYYNEEDLLKLQHILFYKELGFKLKDIKLILDDDDFDPVKSFQSQKEILYSQKTKLETIIKTVENTIKNLKKGNSMNIEELYEGFNHQEAKEYREEALWNWEDEVLKSEKSLVKMDKKDFTKLKQDFNTLWIQLSKMSNENPKSMEVQKLMKEHYKMIKIFWGIKDYQKIDKDKYLGLGKLYINDSRYTKIGEEENPEFAKFLFNAMKYYADENLI